MRLHGTWGALLTVTFVALLLALPKASAEDSTEDDWDNNADAQGLFEDVNEPLPEEDTEEQPPPPDVRYVNFHAKVTLDYYFFDGSEKMTLIYHLDATNKLDLPDPNDMAQPNPKPYIRNLKGSAKVHADVSGFLAKGNGIECLLDVQVVDIPYSLHYKQTAQDKVLLTINQLGPSTEAWMSNCLFADDKNASFNTSGPKETWVNLFTTDIRNTVKQIQLTLSPYESTYDFRIENISADDGDIGSVDIYGEGFIEIEAKQQPKTKAVAYN